MNAEAEKQLLQALYDRLHQLITYQPEGAQNNPFRKNETFIHFTKNEALNPAVFKGMWHAANPNADLGASELFARMVDQVSGLSLEWQPKNQPLSETYKTIVEGMNQSPSSRPSDRAIAEYNEAHDYLYIKEKRPFGRDDASAGAAASLSPAYKAFQRNLDELTGAYESYQTGYNDFVDAFAAAEMKNDENAKRKAQRDWNAAEKSLRRDIRRAQDEFTAGDGKFVQMALDKMNTTLNDAFARALELAKAKVADDQFNAGAGGERWLLSYATPTDWYDPNAGDNFTSFKISSRNKVEDTSSTHHAYTFGSSFNGGLWAVKAQSQGEFKDKRYHMNAEDITISCKTAKVNIVRPWFSELLFRSDNWFTNLRGGEEKEYVSNGKIDSSNDASLLPMYPVAFIVARDITIEADFTEEDKKFISQAVSASSSVSVGPFSIGGGYKYGHANDRIQLSVEGGKLRVPGMQIIGWVSRVLPPSPRKAAKALV